MPNPKISLINPVSNPFSRNAALALAQAQLLQEVVTTIGYNPQGFWSQSLPLFPSPWRKKLTTELGRRAWLPPLGIPVRKHPLREISRLLLGKTEIGRHLGFASLERIYDWVFSPLDAHFAKHHLQGIDAVYGYEDCAAATFSAAKQQGILCLYDLPIPFYRTSQAIQTEEAELFPELAIAFDAVKEPAWKLECKERELQLADHIFVASAMTKKSLLDEGIKEEKISVIPYGAPRDYFQPQTKPDKKFRALFVGRVGPRKGVHYLLQAWQKLQLPSAELLLIGTNEFPANWFAQYEDICHYLPCIPHECLQQYYSCASVFVFPSLVEGFGLVLLEAMACGIPVITTPNTAGVDFITDGVEGFIIPIRDVEALQEKLNWCYENPQELAVMGQAARKKAEQLTWDLYRQRLVTEVQDVMSNK